jgi:ketosteroid isomerase-like protein
MTTAEVARALYRAYAENDLSRAEQLVAPDFRFTSPLDNQLDRATFFERCWPNGRFTGFDLVDVASQGDRVFVVYESTKSDGGRLRNTEILTVRDDVVHAVEVYFGWSLPHDAAPGNWTT